MNMTKYLNLTLLSMLLATGLSTTRMAQASEDAQANEAVSAPIPSGKLYLPSDAPMVDLATAMDSARDSDRLLLLVMGANWCHDSRALASRLFQEPLSTVVDENFEILFVDVGYLEKGKEVITSLGIPIYYATPTVLIIDPVSGSVINNQNRHQWAEAASVSMEDSVEYFQQFAGTDLTAFQNKVETDAALQVLLDQVDTFEQIQADRLYQAYAILGPMLHAYKAGDEAAFSEATWDEVRDYRYKVSADVENLRVEAHERAAAGEVDIQLTYPVYPAFSWDPQ